MIKQEQSFSGRLLYSLMALLGKMPDAWHYFWADVLAFVLRRIIRYRYDVVTSQLEAVFGKEGKKYIKPYYRHLADLMVEYLLLAGFDEERFRRHAVITNPELFRELHEKGHRQIFLLLGHMGNWEYYTGFQLYSDTEYNVLYKRQHGVSNMIFARLRSKFGAKLLDKNDAGHYIIAHRHDNEDRTYIFAGDQEPPYSSINLYTRFLGKSTAVFTGAERLASALGAPVVYARSFQPHRGRYELTLKVITDDASTLPKGELSKTFMDLLEEDILRQPEQWLWSHKRWKHSYEWRKENDPNFSRQNIQVYE